MIIRPGSAKIQPIDRHRKKDGRASAWQCMAWMWRALSASQRQTARMWMCEWCVYVYVCLGVAGDHWFWYGGQVELLEGQVGDVRSREPKLCPRVFLGCGRAEGLHANPVVEVALPAQGEGRLEIHASQVGVGSRNHALLVLGRLFPEEVPAGHGDDADTDALVHEQLLGFNGEVQLAAAASQQRSFAGVAGRPVLQDVGALGHLVERTALQLRHSPSAEGHDAGAGAILQPHCIRAGSFVAVCRAEHQHVGRGADQRDGLDGLVCGSVLA
mmetsp:Transcript_47355/g.118246  ORF Transcript_47355/g.118246 Transcript_47355/m.118246 type:complete len:271 (-) Transcript_47355:1535-2347(-)